MVQSISAASTAANAQIGSATSAKTSGTSFDSILISTSIDTSSTTQTQDSSKPADSSTASKSDKASSTQTTTCSKCGAIYQGDNAPAICTKCGNDMSAKNSGSGQDANSLLDTSGVSNTTNATDSASAVSAVNATSETGNNTNFDFSTQIPATISLQ